MTSQRFISLADQSVRLVFPATLQTTIDGLFPDVSVGAGKRPVHDLVVGSDGPGRYSIESHCAEAIDDVPDGDLPRVLMEEIGRSLVCDMKSAVAVHAGAVALGGKAVLVVGQSGAGKSSLVAWFASHGFSYLSDELVAISPKLRVEPHRRPLIVKPAGSAAIDELAFSQQSDRVESGPNHLLVTPPGKTPRNGYTCGLMIFVAFTAGSDAVIQPLTMAQTTLRLMASNLNARNLDAHGFGTMRDLARDTLAIELRYGGFEQLPGVVDRMIRWILESGLRPSETRRLLSAFGGKHVESPMPAPMPTPAPVFAVPEATKKRFARKLTIGMATYDDFDGTYFTIQALRLYHPEVMKDVEFVVVDNNPSGRCGQPLKHLEKWIPNYRYVPRVEMSGTAIRNAVFEESSGEYVLCIDCHVFIDRGGLAQLLAYFEAHPDTQDLLQGPLLYDNLTTGASHFEPAWRQGMYGFWGKDVRSDDPASPPFDIPMQGLGLFACRRDAWLQFNAAFRGFGGEEGYIHEKFRQAGRRTLCLPFLRWMHRFQRPLGVPYRVKWEDRIRNYWIGLHELGLPTDDMEAHFAELLGKDVMAGIMENICAEAAAILEVV